MEAKTHIASLNEVRLNALSVVSGMNDGAAVVQGNVTFSVSVKSSFRLGGEKVEPPYVLGRVGINAKAVIGDDEKLLEMEAEFIGRYEFEKVVEEEFASRLIEDRDYCELLGLQMQPYVNSKFSEIVSMVGLDLRLPLNVINLRPSHKED